jgi:hypothetical protein
MQKVFAALRCGSNDTVWVVDVAERPQKEKADWVRKKFRFIRGGTPAGGLRWPSCGGTPAPAGGLRWPSCDGTLSAGGWTALAVVLRHPGADRWTALAVMRRYPVGRRVDCAGHRAAAPRRVDRAGRRAAVPCRPAGGLRWPSCGSTPDIVEPSVPTSAGFSDRHVRIYLPGLPREGA